MPINNVPVLLIGFNRPELLIRRVQELLRDSVSTLYISVDDYPPMRAEMKEVLREINELCVNECRLSINLHKENLGLAKHITGEISRILKDYSEVIVLEDDIEIGTNFLVNMSNGLKELREKKIKGVVSGFSPVKQHRLLRISNKWRISPYFNCWGWLCTREAWDSYILDISNLNINEEMKNSKTWNQLNKWQQYLWLSRFIKIQRTPYHTWDIQFQYMCFKNEMSNISPIFSLTNNEGFDDIRSVHTKGKKPRWMAKSKVDSSIISSQFSNSASLLFSKIIEPLTTSGDSRLIRLRNRIKN